MEPIKYITVNERDHLWGLVVDSVGFQSIDAGASYPPLNHNQEHLFNIQKGRVLHEYQLLYITRGSGVLVHENGQEFPIQAGNMFLIFPGQWHSYYPDRKTGWDEYWIAFHGFNIDQRVKTGFFSSDSPVYHIGHSNTIIDLYKKAIEVATVQDAFFQQLLAGIVNHMLGLLFMINQNFCIHQNQEMPQTIRKARQFMQDHVEKQLDMPEVAKYVNMSYTTFRRVFHKFVGVAPIEYFNSLKMYRAKELLRGTNLPVKEISYRLCYKNPEYFTSLFHKEMKMKPTEYRRQKPSVAEE